MEKLKFWWIRFRCRHLGHKMDLIGEKVSWHYWIKWHRCKRCGHTEEKTDFCF